MDADIIERYDRQIRLWGQHGQNKCSSSRVCLVNADSLGIEILRGLCLAGIGSFTILDSHKLTPEDVGASFLPRDCLGKSRGESARKMLLDYNEEVSGQVLPLETHLNLSNQDLQADILDSNRDTDFWRQFNCVIISGCLHTNQLTKVSKTCWTLNVPLIQCKTIGFYGYLRCQTRDHLIIETHPDNILPIFYLDRPFDDLRAYFESVDLLEPTDLDKLNEYPYVVIVYNYLRVWQKQHNHPDTKLPSNYGEKKELKKLLEDGLKSLIQKKKHMRTSSQQEDPVQNLESILPFENYLEAIKSINSCFTNSSALPESVRLIFEHPLMDTKQQNVSRFWIIMRAIKTYVLEKNNGQLPVTGHIPDMTSSSEEFIKLQTIYQKRAREDVDSIFEIVQNLSDSTTSSPGSSLFEETKLICRNIRDLRLQTCSAIFTEPVNSKFELKEEDEDDEYLTIAICLRALDVFFTTYGRIPGYQDDQVETDVAKLRDCVKQLIGKSASSLRTLDQTIYDICRYGGAELHATSAFLGGCVAQETIKLITNQYVPINNTIVYSAIRSSTKSLNLDSNY